MATRVWPDPARAPRPAPLRQPAVLPDGANRGLPRGAPVPRDTRRQHGRPWREGTHLPVDDHPLPAGPRLRRGEHPPPPRDEPKERSDAPKERSELPNVQPRESAPLRPTQERTG